MDYELGAHAQSSQRMDLAERPTRILNTMIHVLNLQRSLDFYIEALGMSLLRRQDYPAGRYTLAFLGYGSEDSQTALELRHDWDRREPLALGSGFGHLAIAVQDIYSTCAELAEKGVRILESPAISRVGRALVAAIEDPDGYRIELVNRR